jgi:uncharacterized protein (DUF433 family)
MGSRVVSVRLKDEDAGKLDRLARQMQRTPSATAALLLNEKLREEEFPEVEFRPSVIGRQAYVKGTRVQVWMLLMIARSYDMDVQKVARHLGWPERQVQAALAYARAFPEEIDPIVDEVERMTADEFVRRYPGTRVVQV